MHDRPGEEQPATLDYYNARAQAGRPGSWIALGIVSLFIALGTIAMNAFLSAALARILAETSPVLRHAWSAPLPPSLAAPFTGELHGRFGLPAPLRKTIIDSISFPSPAGEDMKVNLDRLLSEFGRIAFPDANKPLTVKYGLSSPAQLLIVPQVGWIVLNPERASLLADSKSYAVDHHGFTGDTIAAGKIAADLNRLKQANPRLTSAQLGTIFSLLNKRDRLPFDYALYSSADDWFEGKSIASDGVLHCRVGWTHYYVAADGRWVDADAARSLDGKTGRYEIIDKSTARYVGGSFIILAATMLVCVCWILLGFQLLLAGVRLIQHRPRGFMQHRYWARSMLRTIGLAIMLDFLYLCSCVAYPETGIGEGAAVVGMMIAGASIIQLIYPLIVRTVLNATNSVRYVHSLGLRIAISDEMHAAFAWRGVFKRWGRWLWMVALVLALAHLLAAAMWIFQEMNNGPVVHIAASVMLMLAGVSWRHRTQDLVNPYGQGATLAGLLLVIAGNCVPIARAQSTSSIDGMPIVTAPADPRADRVRAVLLERLADAKISRAAALEIFHQLWPQQDYRDEMEWTLHNQADSEGTIAVIRKVLAQQQRLGKLSLILAELCQSDEQVRRYLGDAIKKRFSPAVASYRISGSQGPGEIRDAIGPVTLERIDPAKTPVIPQLDPSGESIFAFRLSTVQSVSAWAWNATAGLVFFVVVAILFRLHPLSSRELIEADTEFHEN